MEYTTESLYTASSGELIVLLYNAEIKNIKAAILFIKAKNIQKSHEKLIRAKEIIYELISSLDESYAISKELKNLYEFFLKELTAANIKKEAEILENILPLVIQLRDTWIEANQIAGSKVKN